MNFDNVEWSIASIVSCLLMVLVASIAGFVGTAAFDASAKAAAYKAYTECLREVRGQPVDVMQSFCGRIRENL